MPRRKLNAKSSVAEGLEVGPQARASGAPVVEAAAQHAVGHGHTSHAVDVGRNRAVANAADEVDRRRGEAQIAPAAAG